MLPTYPKLLPLAALFLACSAGPQSSTDAPGAARPSLTPGSVSTAQPTSPAPVVSEAPQPSSTQTADPEPSSAASAASTASSSAAECAPLAPPFADCAAAELTGAPPCEAICVRKRSATPNRCCIDPVDIVVQSGSSELLRVAACGDVPLECANVHGHGNMDSRLRILKGDSPPEVVVVEGGCEMRAMMHGYVPPGVAAWTGCNHKRYRWNGKVLAPSPSAKP